MAGLFAKRNFSLDKIPDLTGKTVIVTGSNTGIGRVCALEMARKNATVIMACRNEAKTKPVLEEIKKESNNEKVEFIQLDLMSLAAVKKFVDEFKARHDQLHILLNNAGIMICPFALSEDGIETQFATNHVAHYYLTTLLLPLLETSAPSRVVNVSSVGHRVPFKQLDLESISDPNKYNKIVHYAKSKTANILFTKELSKRLEAKGCSNVYVNCCHPGAVRSELSRHIFSPKSFTESIYNMFMMSPEDGAVTQLYLATSPEVEEKKIKAQYYVPYASPENPRGVAAQQDTPAQLWEFTENLLKEKVPDYNGAGI